MPHNHSPRCCCEPTYNGAIVTSAKPCPSCVEHGELAMLGDNTNRSAQNPAINVPPVTVTTRGEFIGQMVAAAAAAQPAECPSCHAVGDQPHTDYCQLPLTDALRLANAQTNQPAEYTISQPDRGTGWSHQHPDGQRWHHVEGETCTEGNGMPEFARAVQAQTSQPTATTSQPPTHTRAPAGPITSGQPYTLKRGEGILTHLEHAMPGGRTHLRALCHPALCGQQPTPSQ